MEEKEENRTLDKEMEILKKFQEFAKENNFYIKNYKVVYTGREWEIIFSNKSIK